MLQYIISVGDGVNFRRSLQHKVLHICWEQQRELASQALYCFGMSVDRKTSVLTGEEAAPAQAYFVHAVNLAVISSRVALSYNDIFRFIFCYLIRFFLA